MGKYRFDSWKVLIDGGVLYHHQAQDDALGSPRFESWMVLSYAESWQGLLLNIFNKMYIKKNIWKLKNLRSHPPIFIFVDWLLITYSIKISNLQSAASSVLQYNRHQIVY